MPDFYNSATIYVSQTNGCDDASGLRREDTGAYQGPLKTLEAALELVAQLRESGAGQPITIEILGDYFVEKTIVIDNRVDNITITGNGTVHSGREITGFHRDSFNGHDCFSAPVDGLSEGFWFTDFFVDGERAELTTLPKDGCFMPAEVENTEEVYDASSQWFIAKPEDLEYFKGLKNFNDCLITYYHFWVDEHTPIESCDFDTGKIMMKYKSRFAVNGYVEGATMRYWLENAAEAFENKNEWYLDRQSGRVYYIPRSDAQTPENIRAYAPVCTKLFEVRGEPGKRVRGVRFEGLRFAYTRGDYCSRSVHTDETLLPPEHPGYASDAQSVCSAGGALEFYHAENCAISDCVISNVGLHAVCAGAGCRRLKIYANRIRQTGAGAVKINGGAYGCDAAEENCGNVISQNLITGCGRRYAAACGILVMNSYENTISHNDISYGYYSGISVGWVWGYAPSITRDNIIEYNHVHHIGQGKLSDMGGIYLLGEQRGTVVRNNIVNDVTSWNYGANGIYTDEGSSYILIENNIVYNVTSFAFQQHFGRMNVVRNNIAAKCGQIMTCALAQAHTGLICERNIFVAGDLPAYRFGYLETPVSGYVHMIAGRNNLHFCAGKNHRLFVIGDREYDLKMTQREFSSEEGSVFADPLFADYGNNNYSLCENSPAYALGFRDIDTANVGITVGK